ncbi:MAG TPA: hypothetical protein VM165_20640, partial [Planctomycetaceae bacterium]|nr:hypothetical protein [Planctomycetaceae bacterium]
GLFVVSGCGRPAEKVHSDEAAAVAMIRRLGGKVEFDPNSAERRVIKVYLHSTAVTDADLAALTRLSRLQNLFLGKTEISDAGLEHLSALTELKTLSLNSTRVTDAGLNSLATLKNLKTLNVQETQVTAAGTKRLKQALPELAVAR